MTPFDAAIAAASPEFKLSVPVHVFLGEAIDAAGAAKRYWRPVEEAGTKVLPGLCEAGPRLPGDVTAEILALVELAQAAHTAYLLAVNPNASKELLDRATQTVDELEAALEFLFDDGVEDENDAQLKAIKDSTGSNAIDALALDLHELAALANLHEGDLGQIPAFDLKTIAVAKELSAKLRALPPANVPTAEAKATLLRRNQIFQVLDARVKVVRTAARFIFRAFPSVAKEFTSGYERRRRTAYRRAQAANVPPAEAPGTATATA